MAASDRISSDGIVIWQTKTKEADRVLTLLTPGGIVTAYAKNSVRPGAKLTSSTAMLTYSEFEMFSGRNMFTIDDAMPKKRFNRLFSDVYGNAFAVYFCELMRLLAPVNDDASEYMSLLLNSLYLLDEQKKDRRIIKNVFELRLMTYAGYMPDLVACSGCGAFESEKLAFDPVQGIWLCSQCAQKEGKTLNCSSAVLSAMRHIILSSPSKAFSIQLGDTAAKTLNTLCERYVISHVEKNISTLDFLSVLCN